MAVRLGAMSRLPRGADAPTSSLLQSWARQSWQLRILRGFLGGTFVIAGVQKLADPNFLHSGSPDYIGEQLKAFAHGSPIGPFLSIAAHFALLTGIAVALIEMAVGLGTLLGVAPMTFAALGLGLNLVLVLSATWHVHPYFLGSDSIYAVAWGAYLVGLVDAKRRAVRAAQSVGSRRARARQMEELGRREFLRGALVGLGSLMLGSVAFALEGRERAVADPPVPSSAPSTSPTPTITKSTHHAKPTTPPPGTSIASLDNLPIGSAVNFDDPAQGPSVLVRLAQDQVAAYSRVCTHAGCLVDYDRSSKLLLCPCHGAEFDPSQDGQPVAGPAFSPLPSINVTIDQGEVIAGS
jgi:thiosulfate dehydrogenase [quinone] large subunit